MTQNTKTVESPTPKNPDQVKKAVTLGKDMMKNGGVTKAEVARKMYEMIHEESRGVVVQAFISGASLTPRGAQTYFYNTKNKFGKKS